MTTTATSTTNSIDLRGTWTALITPFTTGGETVDETALRNLVEFQIANGVSGLVACGSTGETPTLSLEEFTRTVSIVVEQVAGRVPVMAGTGSNDTATTVARTRLASELGADIALVVMPWYNRPTQEGLYQHIRHVAEQSPLPIVIYNVPSRTGCDILPVTVARLAQIENIIGIKEASGDVDRTSEIVHATDPSFVVLSGDDSLTLPIISVGGQGVISVVSNIVPQAMSALTTAALAGDFRTARGIHMELVDLSRTMFVETNPVPVKAAAELLGICTSEVRLPLVALAPASHALVLQTLLSCRFTADRIILGEEAARFHTALDEIAVGVAA
ncbi:MAG TPA: 4-hydroxy-tetrahydrodipicolinate synthase [Thermomicrobiales bacterium]|nr:4-hydroxy-tetrahydrodipicolinate synthase [Thermomicrobiales bacterium]